MSSIDNLIALKVLYMLVVPFDQTRAYKLGVIDKDGALLIKPKDQTSEQKDAYDYLDRLVFNLKRLIGKLPGGKSQLASIVSALYLIKECEDENPSLEFLEERYHEILGKVKNNQLVMVEEELIVEEILSLFEDGAAPANVTGPGVSTDMPAIRVGKKGRKYGTFNVGDDIFRRFSKGKKKFTRWSEYLDLSDPTHKEIHDYAKKNPKGVMVLKSGDNIKAIRYNRHGGGAWKNIKRKAPNTDIVQTIVM